MISSEESRSHRVIFQVNRAPKTTGKGLILQSHTPAGVRVLAPQQESLDTGTAATFFFWVAPENRGAPRRLRPFTHPPVTGHRERDDTTGFPYLVGNMTLHIGGQVGVGFLSSSRVFLLRGGAQVDKS